MDCSFVESEVIAKTVVGFDEDTESLAFDLLSTSGAVLLSIKSELTA